ncbi:glycosyl hydrolase family 32 [Arthrobacter sp. BE255]|uniref:glycosyl hydrolase family 32 n=1 Tax=Arthrobacter sp. BE255 TaxID=2817721 RepID=UPI0028590012|nr:glycosyl hydrolase family 32 [Arthrobacter sp. BE255]MDR7159166.1 beta-fructofuranosidase [Arthrobacter sp. BE255]
MGSDEKRRAIMLNPEDRWIWDFWHAHDGDLHHLFYLQAPKSLGDPELRHRNATVGHATSSDLSNWTEHGTILTPGGAGTIDATATWTGSVVRDHNGLWRMFYTGSTFLSADNNSNIEAIASAVSVDLYEWTKDTTFGLHADPTWYETLGSSDWPEEAWRDPWVYQDSDGLWHMLITARANAGELMDRGVVGHATSPDLGIWTVQPPITKPGAGLAQLEVLQTVTIDGDEFIVFSTQVSTLTQQRQDIGEETGTWIAPARNDICLEEAVNLTGPSLYSGRVIVHDGKPVLLAFRAENSNGDFLGGITDPLEITLLNHKPALLTAEARS